MNCFKEIGAPRRDDGPATARIPAAPGKAPALPDQREPIVDLRGLEPPEPLVRILDALAGEGPWRFLLSREPFPVYGILRSGGWRYRVRKGEEGVELTVEQRARDE